MNTLTQSLYQRDNNDVPSKLGTVLGLCENGLNVPNLPASERDYSKAEWSIASMSNTQVVLKKMTRYGGMERRVIKYANFEGRFYHPLWWGAVEFDFIRATVTVLELREGAIPVE